MATATSLVPTHRPRPPATVRGHEKVPVYGQVEVLAGGQLKVLIPRSSCLPGLSGLGGDGGGVSQSPSPPRELLLKSARERMDIISAYREAGTYRGAAAISGTTPKTVKPVPPRTHNRRQPPGPSAPSRERSGHRRRFLPHAPSPRQRRNHLEQDLINPEGWGLLTGHHRGL